MTAVIYGVIIAGYVILSAIYIRLGNILEEIRDELKKGNKE